MIKKKYIVLITITLLVILGIYTTIKKFSSGAVPVKEVSLTKTVVTKSVSSSGTLVANKSADLSFGATGRVSYVAVSKGDSVSEGELLARLDTVTLENTAQSYRDARDIAKRNRDLFLAQYSDHHDAAGGDKEYEIKLRTYNEQVSQAEANLDAAISGIRNSYIYAPFSGTVLDVVAKEGETATLGVTAINIADLKNINFEISLDQEDIGSIKLDQVARINLDSYPGHDFKGKVSDVPYFAGSDGYFKVKISVEKEPDYELLMGMNGDSYISVASTEGEVNALEFDQVFTDIDGKRYIWTISKDKTIHKQYIDIGLEGDYYTEIISPITDTIVVPTGTSTQLQEGYKAIVTK